MAWAAIIFVSLTTTVVAGQQPPVQPTQATIDAASLARIRKALDAPPSAAGTPDASKLRVRVDTTQLSDVTVRPAIGAYDYEFKQLVTPDAVKGCGRLTSSECFQSYANQFLTGLLWQHATQRKKLPDPSRP